jgi:hypothetical protein
MSWWVMLVVIPWGLGLALPLIAVLLKLLTVAVNALLTERPRLMLPGAPAASHFEVP